MNTKTKIAAGAAGFILLVGAMAGDSEPEQVTDLVALPIVEENKEEFVAEQVVIEEVSNDEIENTTQIVNVVETVQEETEYAEEPSDTFTKPKPEPVTEVSTIAVVEEESLVIQSSVVPEPTSAFKQESESEPIQSSNGKWYVSSHHSSKYYYHESCDGWQGLSEKYFRSFATEAELKASVPGRTLHYDCQPD